MDALVEMVLSHLNENVSQTGENVEYDFEQVRDIIINLFNNTKEYSIQFAAFLDRIDRIEDNIQAEEDDEIDFAEQHAQPTQPAPVDLGPLVQGP